MTFNALSLLREGQQRLAKNNKPDGNKAPLNLNKQAAQASVSPQASTASSISANSTATPSSNQDLPLISGSVLNSGLPMIGEGEQRRENGVPRNSNPVSFEQLMAYNSNIKMNFGDRSRLSAHNNAQQLMDTYNLTDQDSFNAIASRGGDPTKLDANDFQGLQDNSCAFQTPAPNVPINSPFGPRGYRSDGSVRMHQGVDMAAPIGTDILAAAPGRVLHAGYEGRDREGMGYTDYGNVVVLEHDVNGNGKYNDPEDRRTLYAHLDSMKVRAGDQVSAGQHIAEMGTTGPTSTGSHLHFEVRRPDNSKINPVDVVPGLGR